MVKTMKQDKQSIFGSSLYVQSRMLLVLLGVLVLFSGLLFEVEAVDEIYDAEGNLISERIIFSEGYTLYEYDANGNLVKWTRYDDDGTVKLVAEYDSELTGKAIKNHTDVSDGLPVRWTEYADEGVFVTVREYDNGNLVRWVKTDSEGEVDSMADIEYYPDGTHKRVVASYFSRNFFGGITETKRVTEYDSSGNLIKTTHEDADGTLSVSMNDVESGRDVTTITEADGSVRLIENDANGNKAKETQTYVNGDVVVTEYFDEGRRETTTYANGSIEVFDIDIEYFDGGSKETTTYANGSVEVLDVENDDQGRNVKETRMYADGRIEVVEIAYDPDDENRVTLTKKDGAGNVLNVEMIENAEDIDDNFLGRVSNWIVNWFT